MGVTAMIPGMTFQQLKDEANSRWKEIWDGSAARLDIMLLCPRKERKLLELHGDMIDHGQPVMGIFHRPRVEAELISEQGFDPKAASFQFLNISNADMGSWMQQLVTQEGWLRSTVEIAPVPFTFDIPNQRPFERHSILCFRHPSLPPLQRYYLPYPIHALVGKAFVSLPRRQAAELARQQAEILGVGLAEPEPEIVEVPVVENKPKPVVEEVETTSELESAFISEMIPEESTKVALPTDSQSESVALPEPIEESSVALPGSENNDSTVDQTTTDGSVPLPIGDTEIDDMAPIEREFRTLVQELLDAGVDPSDMMSDARLEDINERAMAQNFETWPVFMQMVS